jgi:glycosyltransferase involved in cell wall biosynthesis
MPAQASTIKHHTFQGYMGTLNSGTVALFSTRFVPYSQTFIYDEVRAHERYEIDVFCKERLNTERFPYNEERVYCPPRWAKKIYENVAYWPSFDRQIQRGNYDLIHAHFGTTAVYALPYVWRHDLPFVVTFWGNDVGALIGSQRYEPTRWRYVALAPKIMAASDLMLGVSEELCAWVRQFSGRPDVVKPYRHGVDLSKFHPTSVERAVPEVVMVGRFTEKKGHRYALRAISKALQAGCELHFSLIGSGELEGECRAYVREHGLEDHVTFHGVLSHDETADRLARADIALVPSVVARDHDREGSPTVVKEASASGVPVIGTYHAGIPETVDDGKTGFLVPERNVPALTDRLIALLSNDDLREAFGRAAREKMEREFDLFEQVGSLERHYDQVLRNASVNEK